MVSETTPMVLAEGHKHTMALDQSALVKVLEALKAAEVDDRIRLAAETIYGRSANAAIYRKAPWPFSPAHPPIRREVAAPALLRA
jgi:hypothetical protein